MLHVDATNIGGTHELPLTHPLGTPNLLASALWQHNGVDFLANFVDDTVGSVGGEQLLVFKPRERLCSFLAAREFQRYF